MKVAIVHDYLKEFGGAERVLKALSEMFPEAPIYTAFRVRGSTADKEFKNKKIIESWLEPLLKIWRLHSPLRFLLPLIWGSFDFSKYDLVISSASWYVTKGFGGGKLDVRSWKNDVGNGKKKPIEICYIHTPPRWLYGYDTPIKKSSLVRAYVSLMAHFVRMYDFKAAQRVSYFVANSINVQKRIEKFYRRTSTVIYPPVDVSNTAHVTGNTKRDYYLIVSRITGGKGIEMAVAAANKLGVKLKIAGSPSGYADTYDWVKKNGGPTVELLGFVPDSEVGELYGGANAFLALERDVDFGMTPVEAMGRGTPVIAYNGGGYPESVVDGETGVLFDNYSTDGLVEA